MVNYWLIMVNLFIPDKDVDGFTVVGAKHDVGRTQKRLQDVDNTGGHLLHLIEYKNRASALCQVPLHPALQLPLQDGGRITTI